MKQQDQPIVTFDRVMKRYRRLRAVDEVTFAVAPGEVVGVVGDDESGKTTLISMMMGFSRPSKGSIELFGRTLKLHTAHRSRRAIGYAAYDTALSRAMTGERYLRALMTRRGDVSSKQYDQLVRVFRPQLQVKISALSSSNRQKIVLMGAFLGSPQLIVLDEPTRGLDPLTREVLLDTIRETSLRGATVIVSSRYPSEIARVCSRMMLFKDGTLVHDLSQSEMAQYGGKNITIHTETEFELPPHAIKIRTGSHRKMKFSYTGQTQQLIDWMAGLEDVDDIEIEPRSLDDEFRHLYGHPEEDDE